MLFTFNHSGKIGDLLYSLYFCKEMSRAINSDKFNLNIQYNVPEIMTGRQNNKIRLTLQGAKFLQPLLKSQSYINQLTISDSFDPKVVQNGFNLDAFRVLPLNFMCSFIPEWYFTLTNVPLKRNYETPLLNVQPRTEFKDKIVLLITERYLNAFVDLNTLKPWEDKMVFVGLDNEYQFIKKFVNIPRVEVKDALEVAQILKGAQLVISNPNGNYAIAELLKANRILIQPHFEKEDGNNLGLGPVNVYCYGGWFEYANTNNKLKGLMENLFPK